jgi:hypothetical protein
MLPQHLFRLLHYVYRSVCINWNPITELVRLSHQRTPLDLSILIVHVRDMHYKSALGIRVDGCDHDVHVHQRGDACMDVMSLCVEQP